MNKLLSILVSAGLASLAGAAVAGGCGTTTDCLHLGTCGGTSSANAGTGGAGGGTGGGSGGGGGSNGGAGTAGGSTNGSSSSGMTEGGVPSPPPLPVCVGKRWGDSSNQEAQSLFVDTAGDVVLAGAFQGELSFGGPTLGAASGPSTFVVSLTPALVLRWNVAVPATYLASAVDGAGDVLIAGTYAPVAAVDAGSAVDGGDGGASMVGAGAGPVIDLGCGPLDPTKSSFVAKLSAATGACVFSQAFAASPSRGSLSFDAGGNVFFAGGVSGVADFGSPNPPTTAGEDIFVVKLNAADGSYAWQSTFGSAGGDTAAGVAVDATGNAYLTGTFSGAVDFGLGGNPLVSTGSTDVFVAALSGSGDTLWATSFPGTGTETAAGVVVVAGGVVVGGTYGTAITLGGTMLSSFSGAIFAAMLDPANMGATLWAQSIGGTALTALAAGPSGQTAYLGASGPDILVAELSPAGALSFQGTLTGMAGSARHGNGIGFSGPSLDVAGFFDGTLTETPDASLVSAGGDDVFLVQLCP